MRLLLIENSHVDSAFVERMLRSAFLQLELVRVENLAKAVLLLEQDMGFDAIIASVSLPDSEGIDTVGRLLEVAAGIPLIALADIEDYGVSKRAIRLGVQDFLSKRILNSETLERSVRYSIERKKLAIRNERLLSSLGESERLLRTRTQKLEKACKTAQTFVENVSHEFRTPLTVIMEYASLLADGVAGSVTEEQSSLLGIIDDRAADLNTMVDDMLDVSKLESGMLGAARCRAEVGEIVSRVLPALQRKSQIREVTLQVDIPEDTPAVYCDSEKTGRVLINLVVNAIKFNKPGGDVTVRVRQVENDEVIVEVVDTGVGIPKTRLDEVFHRFSQVKPHAVEQSTKGFGLGLSIAQELVAINLGSMRVESEEGVGSTFGFTLPVDHPHVVTERFLTRLRASESAPFISLFCIQLPEDSSDADAEETQNFLTVFLRQNDLLLRQGKRSWLVIGSMSNMQVEPFLERLEHRKAKLNRNRPRGPMPDFEIECLLTQPLDADAKYVFDKIDATPTEVEEHCYAAC